MDIATVVWKGAWVNEYGSRLHTTEDCDGRITGTFTTALGDSSFAGATLPIIGLSKGNALHFAFASQREPVTVTAFTGLLRGDTLHMAWLMVSDKAIRAPQPGAEPTEIELPWAHAVQVNTDTFHREG